MADPTTIRSSIELIASIGLGTAFGGFVTRYLVGKWLKDRETFEATVVGDLKAVAKALAEAKEYTDHEVEGLRKHEQFSRATLLSHVDAEDKILRERTHSIDTLTQILVSNISLMREEVKGVVAGQATLTAGLHAIDMTISRMGQKP